MKVEQKFHTGNQKQCVACKEAIIAEATTCPHCGSSQLFYRYKTIVFWLRWLGGIVTTITLVIGVITLNQFYQEWIERKAVITEMVEAADWLIKTDNYQHAWHMYNKAAQLNQSSRTVRNGQFKLALLWVKHFQVSKGELNDTLNDITDILYRGLPDAAPKQASTILAHIGYVQVIRKLNRLPILVNTENLFNLALSTDSDNADANAMFARWLLLEKPMTIALISRADKLFNNALTNNSERQFIRRIQFNSLTNYTYGYSDEIELASLSALLKASVDMMNNGEPLPSLQVRSNIIDGYGRMGKAEHVEALLNSIPAETHLSVYQWLKKGDYDERKRMQSQSDFIIARLTELQGNTQQSLTLFELLLSQQTTDELAHLVNVSIERLTGKLPLRAQTRNYIDDPVDSSNPIPFHLATLKHYDPTERSKNIKEAFKYFNQIISETSNPIKSLEVVLPEQINRCFQAIRQGDKIQQMNAYTSGFAQWHHDNARQNLIDLTMLYKRVLISEGLIEQAIAQLSDLLSTVNSFDNGFNTDWPKQIAIIEFELATQYTDLTSRSNDESDKEQAILFLLQAVEHGVINNEGVTWTKIKGRRFSILKTDKRYQKLIRGR